MMNDIWYYLSILIWIFWANFWAVKYSQLRKKWVQIGRTVPLNPNDWPRNDLIEVFQEVIEIITGGKSDRGSVNEKI